MNCTYSIKVTICIFVGGGALKDIIQIPKHLYVLEMNLFDFANSMSTFHKINNLLLILTHYSHCNAVKQTNISLLSEWAL